MLLLLLLIFKFLSNVCRFCQNSVYTYIYTYTYIYIYISTYINIYISKSSIPDSEADFSEKLLLGSWRLILSSWHIVFNIEHIILNIQYIKGNVKNRYKIIHLIRSIILNFLLEYVLFLIKYAAQDIWHLGDQADRSTLPFLIELPNLSQLPHTRSHPKKGHHRGIGRAI